MQKGAGVRLTEEQIETARQLHSDGWTISRIRDRMGCCYHTIRRIIDPDYAVTRRIKVNEARHKRNASEARSLPPRKTGRENATSINIKEDAAARLAEIPADTRTLTGRLAGDPLFERSALYKKMKGLGHA